MDMLRGQLLLKAGLSELVPAESALENVNVVCYYFSAHWCPPCRMFTPILADFYEELKTSGQPLEVIFVSSDRSADDMKSYMEEAHGSWMAVPWGSPLASSLKAKYQVTGIPALVVVKKSDGTVITTDGRSQVHRLGVACFSQWNK